MNQICLLNGIALVAAKHKSVPNGRFLKKRLTYFTFNINSLLPKINDTGCIAKQLNASITGIIESKHSQLLFQAIY